MIKYFIATSLIASSMIADVFELQITADTVGFDYTECVPSECPFNKEQSTLFDSLNGISIDMKYKLPYAFDEYDYKVGFGYQKFVGNTKYTGDYLNNPQGYGTVKSYSSAEISTKNLYLQVINNIEDDRAIYLNAGFGERIWNRGLSTTQTEIYEWPYFIFGIGYEEFSYDQKLSVGIEASYKQAINPKMKWVEENLVFDLGKTDGFKVKIPIKYELVESLYLTGSYEHDTWNIEKSNTVGGYYEPASTTKSNILSAGILYKY